MNQLQFRQHQESIERQIHQVWTPHEGQIPIASAFFEHWMTGVFLRCGRKFGKLNRLDEPILTPSGYRDFGTINIGDEVFDEQGDVQKVVYRTPIQYDHPAYKVHFCNGTSMEVGEEHLWFTWTKADRKNSRRGLSFNPSVKSTREVFETQMVGKEFNHSIPYTKPIQLPTQSLKIDPYLLGLWLGDGGSHNSSITTTDEEVLQSFRNAGYTVKHYSKYDYGISGGFCTLLRTSNLLKNKHIPSEYLIGSESQRMALLQGLMDSDGTINKTGNHCCFDNTNKNLADGVYHLVASLGMKPIMSDRVGKLNGVEHKLCYRVMFAPLLPVFKLKRHLDKIKYNDVKFKHHTIKKVEKCKSSPMRCISVTGDSHLYLIGKSLIPTHNTEFMIYCMYMIAMLFDNVECYYIADEKDHARDICWDNRRLPEFFTSFRINKGESQDDFRRRRATGAKLHNNWVHKVNESEMFVRLKNGSMIKVDGAKNWKKADGLGPAFMGYDEFKNHDKRYDTAARPNLMDLNGRVMIIGTPPDNEDNYYCETEVEFQNKPNHLYFKRPSWTNPHVYGGKDCPKLAAEREAYERKGELHVYLREYECEIVPDLKRQIFPMFKVPGKNFEIDKYEGRTKHVRPHFEVLGILNKRPKDWDWYICFDAGSAVTFGVLYIAINRYTKQVVVCEEGYHTEQADMTTKTVYDEAERKMDELQAYRAHWTQIYDHAATWFANEVAAEYDEALNPCSKDVKKKEAKLSFIKDIMLEHSDEIDDSLLIVSDRCQNFIKEISTYAKDDNGRLPKKNDHLIDCFRYILNEAYYDTLFEEYKEKKRHRRFETPETDQASIIDANRILGGY